MPMLQSWKPHRMFPSLTFDDYLAALKNRHDFFASMGCTVSDHGLEEMYAADFTWSEINSLFAQLRSGKNLSRPSNTNLKAAMLLQFADMGLGERMGAAISPGCLAQQ